MSRALLTSTQHEHTSLMVKTDIGVTKKNGLFTNTSANGSVKSVDRVDEKTGNKHSKKTSTKGPNAIEKKDEKEKKDKKNKKKGKKTPFFHQLKKVRHPAHVKAGLMHIFDQLAVFPSKRLGEMFMENGIADVAESSNAEKIEAAKSRKERALWYSNKTRVAFVGREAANTLMVIFYNPASVSVLMEEIKAKHKDVPAHILVVRFESAFVVIITDANVSSRFPYRSWVESGDSTSCFIWFNIKEISWHQKFPVNNKSNVKFAVLQKATPLTVVGHVLVAYFEAKSKAWTSNSIKDDKTSYHLYVKPIGVLNDPGSATDEDLAGLSWVEQVTEFVSFFSVVKAKTRQDKKGSDLGDIGKSANGMPLEDVPQVGEMTKEDELKKAEEIKKVGEVKDAEAAKQREHVVGMSNSGPIQTGVLDSEVVDPKVDSEVVDPKVVDSKMIEPKVVDSKMVDSKMVDSEMVDSDVVDSDVVDSDVVDSDVVDPKVVDSEMVDSEMVDSEMVDSEMVDSEMVDSEMVDSDMTSMDVLGVDDDGIRQKESNVVALEIVEFVNSLISNIIQQDHLKNKRDEMPVITSVDGKKADNDVKKKAKIDDNVKDKKQVNANNRIQENKIIQEGIDIGICGMNKASCGYFQFDQEHDFYEDDASGMYDAIESCESKWKSPKGRYT
jgi:hypothetical protein